MIVGMRNLVTGSALWMVAAGVSVVSGVAAVTLIGPAQSSDVLSDEQVEAAMEKHESAEKFSDNGPPGSTSEPSLPSDDTTSSMNDTDTSHMYETAGGTINTECVDNEVVHDAVTPMTGWDAYGPEGDPYQREVSFTSLETETDDPYSYTVTYWCDGTNLMTEESDGL